MQQQTSTSTSTQPPLRRAVYIHVSDLTSAYNIDHKKLEQELSRVNIQKVFDGPSSPSTQSTQHTDEASVASLPQKRLQPPRGGFNLCVLVGKVSVVVDKLRVDRSRVRLAEVEIGDETGIVSLRARDEQIDILEEISNRDGAAVLRNCTLELFQGKHIRLAVTKWGKLSVYPDDVASTPPPPSKINRERNFSMIDLSLVASEMVENQPPEQGGYAGGSRETPQDRNKGQGPNRQPFQAPQYEYPRQPAGRGVRDRRHLRAARGPGGNPIAVPFPELPMPSQMRYSHLGGYGYGDAMEMSHYAAYGTHPQPSPDAQQLLHLQQQQHHQYEMQHRQMQQMNQMHLFHDHQQHQQPQQQHQQPQQQHGDHRRPMTHQLQQNLGQGVVPKSFDTGPPEFPALPGIVVMHGEGSKAGLSPPSATTPTGADVGPWHRKQSFEHNVEDQSIGSSPGRMNPQATAFAPSYGKQQGRGQPIQATYPGYNPYDHQQRIGASYAQQQHAIYTQNIVYIPVHSGVVAPAAVAPNQSGNTTENKKGKDATTSSATTD